jgi:beta-lactam-binding protein with PASTA domain
LPPRPFPQPAVQVITVTIDTRNGCLASAFTPIADQAQATFQPGAQPTRACPEAGDKASMLDVTGLPVADATATLTNAGFEVTQEKQVSSTHPPGRVLDQRPAPGTEVTPGTRVTLVVSVTPGTNGASPAPQATVPDVVGLARRGAERAITADFRPAVKIEKQPGHWRQHRGQVWQQSPSGGTKAELDSTVTIWVNPS